MKVIRAENAHTGLYFGMQLIQEEHIIKDSRNGQVMVHLEPVTTVYKYPKERVVFQSERDANPFFHFMEGLWMLGGRDDTAWLSQFNSSIVQYSDDGVSFHGAYGYRWLHWFENDQLELIANMLKKNKDERRAVLQMWDCNIDLGHDGKDVPCNTHIYFQVINGALDMTVCCRSNDIIWGCYGANVVHFSMLMEVMAAWIGVPVGVYRQMSNNWHVYMPIFEKHKHLLQRGFYNPYKDDPELKPFPMVTEDVHTWFQDLHMFLEEGGVIGFRDPFFRKVVLPIYNAWFEYKDKENPNRFEEAEKQIEYCAAKDWKAACGQWLARRRLAQHV